MKRLLLFLPLLYLLSCSEKKDSARLFTQEMLASQHFIIDGNKDTALTTLHGSIIRLRTGTFNTSEKIKIEIREAFSPAEILAAGMRTESKGRPLRSGGMIYINAKVNDEITQPTRPISISIPNQYYDTAMQVFKGVEDSSGINWVDPYAVDSTPQSKNWLVGKQLFMSRCASCHTIFTDRTGPALLGVERRGPWRDRRKLYEYVRNPAAFMETSPYVRNLFNRYRPLMVAFPAISNEGLDAIFDYIKNEEKRPGAWEEESRYVDSIARTQNLYNIDTASTTNPCVIIDTIYNPVPRQDRSFFQDNLSADPIDTSKDTNTTPPSPVYLDDTASRDISFTDPNPTSGMYDFEIQTLGWYNIDAFMEGYIGTTIVKVRADLQNAHGDMNVYLFCPDKKILSVGNSLQGNKVFFDKINGGVPLFLRDRAILFAFGSKGDKMYYGISEFILKTEQTIPVVIKETTDKELRRALLQKQMSGIDIGIDKKEKEIIERPCDEITPVADSTSVK